MKIRLTLLALLGLCCAQGASALLAQVAPAQARRARVLVVNVPDSNHADSGNAGAAAIKELAAADGYDVEICADYGLFTDSYLAPYDAMVWVMAAPLTWTDASKAAFEKYVRSGKGFIALHVAGLTGISRTPWPWFDAYLGGIVFKGHPARQTATVKVDHAATAHPIMKGVAPSFSVFEEWYSWNRSPRGAPGITVLAGLDESSYNVGNLAMGVDHPFVWINEQYGRMLYAGFGHEPAIYRDANVRTLLRNAILWAAERPAAPAPAAAQRGNVPTYSKDVAPILQKNCQVCHRPGEAAPFSLLTYEDARPRARTIRNSVVAGTMPPWHADPRYGKFSNSMSLTRSEIDTIARWADEGTPQGNPRDLPKPATWVEGWGIGKPDMVVELPLPFDVPARGVVDYQHIIVPTNFTEDRWIQAAEVRPTERMVVHHIIAFVREPKSKWFRGQPAGVFFTAPKVSTDEETEAGALPSDFLVGYAPGQPAEILEPGQAKLVKAGSDIVFQLHYTPHGHALTDRSRLGVVFAKKPPAERVLTLSAVNSTFKIPPGHPNYRVDASFELGADVKLASLHPHMHGRGKDFEYRAVFPSGRTDILLKVPRFNWRWQNWYNLEKPIALPKGAKIDATAHFDNSPNNPDNPDPTKEVAWGDQHWDEMMIGFFNLVFDAKLPVDKLFVKAPKAEIAGSTQTGRARRIIALAEPGQTLHQPFADAALRWLQEVAPREGFTVDYIRTTDPIDEAYLAAHDLFVQVNYPPYRWTPVAEAAFKKAMEQGTIGWVGFHHASLLGRFDGFEMSPFFHQFMGNIVFKSYIRDFATGTVRVEDAAHPLFKGLPAAFKIENDEWYTYDRSPRPDVRVLANVDENSYEPARDVKMGDHPVIWTNPRYKARNVYFQFGHKAELFQSDAFKTLFLNAVRWGLER